jgi:hypothetical protein
MYKHNIEVRSCKHCCSGKAISITYSECVSVALVVQHAVCMHIICGLSSCTIFFHIISWKIQFLEIPCCTYNMCFDFLYNFCLNISHCKKNLTRYVQNCTHCCCWILIKLEFSWQIFEKYSNIKFHEKNVQWELSSSMQTDGQTDMTNLIVAFCSFVIVPKRKSWEWEFELHKNFSTWLTNCFNSRDVCTYCSEEPADDSGSGFPWESLHFYQTAVSHGRRWFFSRIFYCPFIC